MDVQLSTEIAECVRYALSQDIGPGDITTNSIVPSSATLRARIMAKQPGIVAGLDIARHVFRLLNETINFNRNVEEGEQVTEGKVIAEVWGSGRALLTGERTALNFVGRMSGIATLTRRFVDAVSGTRATILDTRKTAPGLRPIDKLAVLRGGGQNHRAGLYDMVLIKDNHIDCAGSLSEAVRRVRAAGTALEIEVEARTLDDVKSALDLGVKRILLDNMPIEKLREAVDLNTSLAKLEASGNVTLQNVRQVAETGVDFISVGALTHSAEVFDVTLQWMGR